jgi:hypothetical protein
VGLITGKDAGAAARVADPAAVRFAGRGSDTGTGFSTGAAVEIAVACDFWDNPSTA